MFACGKCARCGVVFTVNLGQTVGASTLPWRVQRVKLDLVSTFSKAACLLFHVEAPL